MSFGGLFWSAAGDFWSQGGCSCNQGVELGVLIISIHIHILYTSLRDRAVSCVSTFWSPADWSGPKTTHLGRSGFRTNRAGSGKLGPGFPTRRRFRAFGQTKAQRVPRHSLQKWLLSQFHQRLQNWQVVNGGDLVAPTFTRFHLHHLGGGPAVPRTGRRRRAAALHGVGPERCCEWV